MKNHMKVILISVITLALLWTLMLTVYTGSIAEELKMLRREKLSDNLYLRCRIRELESNLTSALLKDPETGDKPVGGNPPTDSETDTGDSPTEEITLPTHDSPETVPPEDPGDSTTAQYILAEYEGILGVFDTTGKLLRTVNVYVMTLPLADREALSVGIPAYSEAEMEELIRKYG